MDNPEVSGKSDYPKKSHSPRRPKISHHKASNRQGYKEESVNNQMPNRNKSNDGNKAKDKNNNQVVSRDSRKQGQDRSKSRNNNYFRSRRNKAHNQASQQKNRPKANPSGQISDNFFTHDFACTCGECDKKFKMSLVIIGILESVVAKMGDKPEIVKGFLCENFASKQAITKKSYHIIGKAVDIKVPADKLALVFNHLEGIAEVRGLGIDYENSIIQLDTREKEPQKWAIIGGEQKDLTSELRQKYSLGEEVVLERKDFITA